MASGLDLKERMSFRLTFAQLYYGNGPFASLFRHREGDEGDKNAGWPLLYLEFTGGHYKLRELLEEKRPATARVYRHPTGHWVTRTGNAARGQLRIGKVRDGDSRRGYVEILGLLPPEVFDVIASALLAGGRDLLMRSHLHIGFMDEREKIDFDIREGDLEEANLLLGDIAVT